MSALFPWLVAASVVLVVLAAALLLMLLLGRRRRLHVSERLLAEGGPAPAPGAGREAPWFMRLAEGGRGMERWFRDSEGEDTGQLLIRAGWRSTQARSLYYLVQAGLPLAGVGLVLLAWVSAGQGFRLQLVLIAFMAFAIGMLAPRFLLRQAVAARALRIRDEVPLFINLMVLLFEAGLSTRQALHSLVRDGGGVLPELAGEFRLALRQIEAGGDIAEVLTAMGRTLDVAELSGVLGVLRQVDRYGGEVREPLLSALAVFEERRELMIQERVNALAGYMTWVMVLFFFPALMLCVAGPAFTAIFRALGGVL